MTTSPALAPSLRASVFAFGCWISPARYDARELSSLNYFGFTYAVLPNGGWPTVVAPTPGR